MTPVDFIFIPLMIILIICIISSFSLDNTKKDTTDKKYRIIKRTISFILIAIAIFIHFALKVIKHPQGSIIDIVSMIMLIITSIILLYTNKKTNKE